MTDLEYTKGKIIQVTDTLGQVALQDNSPEIAFVDFVMSSLPISEKSLQNLMTETAKDDRLKKIRRHISWTEHCHNLALSQAIPPL